MKGLNLVLLLLMVSPPPVPSGYPSFYLCPIKEVRGRTLIPEWKPRIKEGTQFTIWYAACRELVRDKKGRVIKVEIFEKPHFPRILVGEGVFRKGKFLVTKTKVRIRNIRIETPEVLYLAISLPSSKLNPGARASGFCYLE